MQAKESYDRRMGANLQAAVYGHVGGAQVHVFYIMSTFMSSLALTSAVDTVPGRVVNITLRERGFVLIGEISASLCPNWG